MIIVSCNLIIQVKKCKDVTPELALKTIKSIKVSGVLSASDEVKAALGDRIK